MKTNKLLGFAAALTMLAATVAQATLYTPSWTSGFADDGVIPDDNPGGWSDTRTLSGIGDLNIQYVNVHLEISGGYNGDLYGYLVHDSGFAVLLNRVGTGSGGEPQNTFGWSTSGFGSFTLDDTTDIGNIHDESGNPNGHTYNSDQGQMALQNFNTLNPNGTWTLFLADMAGGETSTLVSWGLDIEAVPEPTTWALVIFAVLAGSMGVGRWVQRRVRSAGVRIGL